MENIINRIMQAQQEAIKRNIEANTVVLNGNLAEIKPFWIGYAQTAAETPRMIAGLSVELSYELPNSLAFCVLKGKPKGNRIGYERRKEIYQEAINTWGMDAQVMVAIEEMSELTKELCKAKRGKDDAEAVADEIADVTIMLEQLRMMFDINDLVCKHMDDKVERLAQRISEGRLNNERSY